MNLKLKGLFSIFLIAILFQACDTSYTAMSEEELQAKVDSTFSAQKMEIVDRKTKECKESLRENINKRVEELRKSK